MVLGYRHAFHAGCHADVFKHCTLLSFLRHLRPAVVVDSHSGAGKYILTQPMSTKRCEHLLGVSRVVLALESALPRSSLSPSGLGKLGNKTASEVQLDLKRYVQIIRKWSSPRLSPVRVYPGSPLFIGETMRELGERKTRMEFFELHPKDAILLEQTMRKWKRSGEETLLTSSGDHADREVIHVHKSDGFKGVADVVKDLSRDTSALVLMDPSYELVRDYKLVESTVRDVMIDSDKAVSMMVWYPRLKTRNDAEEMVQRIIRVMNTAKIPWVDVQLDVIQQQNLERGMYGSGVLLLGPTAASEPFRQDCHDILQPLKHLLSQGVGAASSIRMSHH